MNDKYFIPEIEDIRIGYQCEFTTDRTAFEINNTDDIIVDKLGILEVVFLIKTLYELGAEDELYKYIRTPYLTKEQIEAEGWKESDVPEFFDRVGNDRWYLSWEPKFNRLTIGDNENEYGFTGECKDINTLREIQKLLKIK